MAKKKRLSYGWALRFSRFSPELDELSSRAFEGWEYARALALNARARSRAALAHDILPERLTAADLAGPWGSPVQVHAAIKQARIELFGRDLTRSAIAYRLARRDHARRCAEPGCDAAISALAHGNIRYCPRHSSGRARAVRRRRTRRTTARDEEHLQAAARAAS